MKKKSEQDSSDLLEKGKEEPTLTFKNLNLGNQGDNFQQKWKSREWD